MGVAIFGFHDFWMACFEGVGLWCWGKYGDLREWDLFFFSFSNLRKKKTWGWLWSWLGIRLDQKWEIFSCFHDQLKENPPMARRSWDGINHLNFSSTKQLLILFIVDVQAKCVGSIYVKCPFISRVEIGVILMVWSDKFICFFYVLSYLS